MAAIDFPQKRDSVHAMADSYVPLEVLATELGLPHAWLKREVQRGRIPHIKAGRFIRFSIAQVRGHLRRRAEAELPSQEQPA